MGSCSYDRDVYSGSSYSDWGASSYSQEVFKCFEMSEDMNPKYKNIISQAKNPIIIALDVTGSNIAFARLVYDKLPMFYGEIENKKYLDDFDICICAVGDAACDDYPIQIGTPAKGIEIDSWLEKLVLEAGGGGNDKESYELMAYYLANKTFFRKDASPILFFIGDEPTPKMVKNTEVNDVFGEILESQRYSPWEKLNRQFKNNVYCLLNSYAGNDNIYYDNTWKDVLPAKHVIKIQEEKAIVDLMLGILSLSKKI